MDPIQNNPEKFPNREKYYWLFIVGTFVYPAWAWVVRIFDPEAIEQPLIRALIGCVCLIVWILSRFKILRNDPETNFVGLGFLMFTHLAYLAHLNFLSNVMVFGTFLLVFITASCIDSTNKLLAYFAYTIVGSLLVNGEGTHVPKGFFVAVIVTAAIVVYVAHYGRVRLIRQITTRNRDLDAYVRAFSDLHFVVSSDFEIKECRSGNENIAHFAPDTLLGMKIDETFPALAAKRLVAAIKFVGNRPSLSSTSVELDWDQEGETYHFEAVVSEVEAGRFSIAVRDVSDRRHREAKLLYSSKMASLGEMAGGIAHEINNPLAILSGFAFHLQEGAKSGPIPQHDAKEIGAKINGTVQRIAVIVNSLRNFAREDPHAQGEPIPVQAIIDSVKNLCQERFRVSGVELTVDCDPELKAWCRRINSEQILLNLLNNSFYAVARAGRPLITIVARAKNQTVEIDVSDYGEGIPEEIAGKVTQPFFTTKPHGEGTGLGLSVSKGLAESQDGTLLLLSYRNPTTFRVVLPMERERGDSE